MELSRDSRSQEPSLVISNVGMRLLLDENCGSGVSRNAGIEAAQGEYLSFVDPDDYIDPDFLSLLYEKASREGLDIVKGRHCYELEDGTQTTRIFELNAVIRERLPRGYPLYHVFSWQHQSALYRRELVMKSGSRYGISRKAQDTTFLLKICHAAHSFGLEEGAVYHFCEREGSAMHSFSEHMLREHLLAYQEQTAYLSGFYKEDPFALQYAQNQLNYCLKLQVYCSRKQELQSASAAFLAGLRETVIGLPFSEEMARTNSVTRILVRYGENLCLDTFSLPWHQNTAQDYLEIAERWTEFMLRHPECIREYRWGLSNAFEQARQMCADHASQMQRLNELEKELPKGRKITRRGAVRHIMRLRHAAASRLPVGMALQLKKWLHH